MNYLVCDGCLYDYTTEELVQKILHYSILYPAPHDSFFLYSETIMLGLSLNILRALYADYYISHYRVRGPPELRAYFKNLLLTPTFFPHDSDPAKVVGIAKNDSLLVRVECLRW